MPELAAAHEAVQAMIPRLAEARRRYAASRSEADEVERDRVQLEAEQKEATFQATLRRVEVASGIPEAVFDELSKPKLSFDDVDRTARSKLTSAEIAPTASIDETLPRALEALLERLPEGWLDKEPSDQFRLPLDPVDRPVSIVKGVRPESEFQGGHRLRQMIQVSRDFLAEDARYDHFAGALLVPQLARLGECLAVVETIEGGPDRIANLWKKPSEVDNTIFELLVAAALEEKGRRPAFIPETQEKTPDIRCHDPFPMVIECKRRAALSEFERQEEAIMRAMFLDLRAAAQGMGLTGVFEVDLSVEAAALDVGEVVRRCLLQRLAAHPERPLAYPWGTVAFRTLPHSMELPASTKAYSPQMLHHAFDWNSDLPEWDGLICRVETAEGMMVSEVSDPIALTWRNSSTIVVEKRSRPPTSLFGAATKQIPGGEIGIVYLAYNEGAREEIADRRVAQVAERLREWEHSAMFRIPAVFLIRLYPRTLDSGRPDLIESVMQFYSEVSGGDPWIFEAYPSRLFTPS